MSPLRRKMVEAMRIRHFGFLANRCRAQRLAQIRTAVEAPATDGDDQDAERGEEPANSVCERCRGCRAGTLHLVAELAPTRREGG